MKKRRRMLDLRRHDIFDWNWNNVDEHSSEPELVLLVYYYDCDLVDSDQTALTSVPQ